MRQPAKMEISATNKTALGKGRQSLVMASETEYGLCVRGCGCSQFDPLQRVLPTLTGAWNLDSLCSPHCFGLLCQDEATSRRYGHNRCLYA